MGRGPSAGCFGEEKFLHPVGTFLFSAPSTAGVAQLVEHFLAKEDVESSSLFTRSPPLNRKGRETIPKRKKGVAGSYGLGVFYLKHFDDRNASRLRLFPASFAMSKAPQRNSLSEESAYLAGYVETLRRSQAQLRKQREELVKRMEEFRESESRYQDLFRSAPVGYITTDMGGCIEEANGAAAALLSTTPAALRRHQIQKLIAPEDRPHFVREMQSMRVYGVSRPLDVRIEAGRRVSFPARVVALPAALPDERHELRFALIDTSELKAVERQLAEAKEMLERRVVERTLELQKANAELSDQIAHTRRLENHLLEVSERERRRFGQDLHDETCQALTGLAMQLAVLYQRLQKEGVAMAPEFRDLAVNLNDLVNQTRRIAHGLHPVSLTEGLPSALHALAATVAEKLECKVRAAAFKDLPPEIALALYRIAQEALTNAVKHASASRATIRLRESGPRLVLSVEDNGIGLPKEIPQRSNGGGMGMDILGYRARSIGGQVIVENLARGGVRVACYVPCSWRLGNGQKNSAVAPRARRKEMRKVSKAGKKVGKKVG